MISSIEVKKRVLSLSWKNETAKAATATLVDLVMDPSSSRGKKGEFDMMLLNLASIFPEDQKNIVAVFDIRTPDRVRPTNARTRFVPQNFFASSSSSGESEQPDCPDCPPTAKVNTSKSAFLEPIGEAQLSGGEKLPLPSDLYDEGEIDQLKVKGQIEEARPASTKGTADDDPDWNAEKALDDFWPDSAADVLSHFGFGIDDDDEVRDRLIAAMDHLGIPFSPSLKNLQTMADRIFDRINQDA